MFADEHPDARTTLSHGEPTSTAGEAQLTLGMLEMLELQEMQEMWEMLVPCRVDHNCDSHQKGKAMCSPRVASAAPIAKPSFCDRDPDKDCSDGTRIGRIRET